MPGIFVGGYYSIRSGREFTYGQVETTASSYEEAERSLKHKATCKILGVPENSKIPGYRYNKVWQEYTIKITPSRETINKAKAAIAATSYRKKDENMSKKNRKFDNLDSWRVTVLDSAEDVTIVPDEENNQDVAYAGESVIGVFDHDLSIGTLREDDGTIADREEWEKSLGQDELTLTKDVEDNGVEVVIAKDQTGKIVGTYTDVNGVGRGVKVQEATQVEMGSVVRVPALGGQLGTVIGMSPESNFAKVQAYNGNVEVLAPVSELQVVDDDWEHDPADDYQDESVGLDSLEESARVIPFSAANLTLLAESAVEVDSLSNQRSRTYSQYGVLDGNTVIPAPQSKPCLEAAVYQIGFSYDTGIFFSKKSINSDKLLKFEDSRYNALLDEIDSFWAMKEDFQNLGFTHKRGMILYGAPGVGKSSLLRLATEATIKKDTPVFFCNDFDVAVKGIKAFREIEPDRNCMFVFEDIDEIIRNEHAFLEFMDGESQTDGTLLVCTTNYLDRLPARVLRAGRLDTKIEVFAPPPEGRKAYFKYKLGEGADEAVVDEMVTATPDFSFAECREFLVNHRLFKKDIGKAAALVRSMDRSSMAESVDQISWEKALRLAHNNEAIAYVVYNTVKGKREGNSSKVAFKNACENENLYDSDPRSVQARQTASRILRGLGVAATNWRDLKV